MKWFTADTHFCHSNILSFSPNRCYGSLEDMHASYIKRWNEIVKPEDTVYILGDFALGRSQEMKDIISVLKGKKILIRGNHDKKSAHWYIMAGFENVFSEALVWVGHNFVTLSHYPMRLRWWERIHLLFTEPGRLKHVKNMPERHDRWHLHGHIHDRYVQRGKQLNVGVDVWREPLSEDVIAAIIKDGPQDCD